MKHTNSNKYLTYFVFLFLTTSVIYRVQAKADVLQDAKEYYQSLCTQMSVPANVTACKKAGADFTSKYLPLPCSPLDMKTYRMSLVQALCTSPSGDIDGWANERLRCIENSGLFPDHAFSKGDQTGSSSYFIDELDGSKFPCLFVGPRLDMIGLLDETASVELCYEDAIVNMKGQIQIRYESIFADQNSPDVGEITCPKVQTEPGIKTVVQNKKGRARKQALPLKKK